MALCIEPEVFENAKKAAKRIEWSDLTALACKTFAELLEHPDAEIRLKTARTIMELKLDAITR